MRRPDELRGDTPLEWSTGTGNQVWEMFVHCQVGNLDKIKRMVQSTPELVECQHCYRTPIYFAVRENQIDLVRFLLTEGAKPVGLMIHDSLLEISRDRGYIEMELLLAGWIHGEDVPPHAGETIGRSIRDHDFAKLTQILDSNPNWISARDEGGNEPIHWATMTRQPR